MIKISNQKSIGYAVITPISDEHCIVGHAIRYEKSNGQTTFFPAIFNNLEDAIDYASDLYEVIQVTIRYNKKNLNQKFKEYY